MLEVMWRGASDILKNIGMNPPIPGRYPPTPAFPSFPIEMYQAQIPEFVRVAENAELKTNLAFPPGCTWKVDALEALSILPQKGDTHALYFLLSQSCNSISHFLTLCWRNGELQGRELSGEMVLLWSLWRMPFHLGQESPHADWGNLGLEVHTP